MRTSNGAPAHRCATRGRCAKWVLRRFAVISRPSPANLGVASTLPPAMYVPCRVPTIGTRLLAPVDVPANDVDLSADRAGDCDVVSLPILPGSIRIDSSLAYQILSTVSSTRVPNLAGSHENVEQQPDDNEKERVPPEQSPDTRVVLVHGHLLTVLE